jgi:hypothetical protein
MFLHRRIITTMLSSVVAVTQNSPRTRQSAQSKGLVRYGLLATALPSRHPLLTGHLSPAPGFLIANPELEFPATCCKHRSELFSNRKFSAVLRSPRRILDRALRRDPATISIVPLFSSSLEIPASSLQNLIVTRRLKSPATATKQDPNPISNRYKSPFFAPFSHSSPITCHSSRLTVAPTSRKAIMCRNHFTQFPRFKPLMRKVTNADSNQS